MRKIALNLFLCLALSFAFISGSAKSFVGIGSSPVFVAANGVPAFSPISYAGLELWLDAADTATITSSGGLVSQWNDKSGNNNHATQGVGADQPITGTITMNGLNAIDFDGAGDHMILPHASLGAISTGANTIIVVWASDTSAVTQYTLGGFVGGGTRWGLLYNVLGSNRVNGVNNTSFLPTDHTVTEDTSDHIDFMRRSGTTLDAGRDGAFTTTTRGLDVTVDLMHLSGNASGTSGVNGPIVEVFIYSRYLSDVEMNQFGRYLSLKWGISWAVI